MIVGLIPGAGQSRRMGRPKLILPVDGMLVIAKVVRTLREGGADRVVVVAPPISEPGSSEMIQAAEGQGAEVVVAEALTTDMRASVELGLAWIAGGIEPTSLLLTPGDLPGLIPEDVARVISGSKQAPGQIVVPQHQGRRGHPVLIPWTLAKQIPKLPNGVGVNVLLREHAEKVLLINVDDPSMLADLDTPEDYRAWSDQ